jgi:ABC-2 type transport system ATP-binding protein
MYKPVETRGLSKHYGRVAAVRDLDLTVEEGEVYGFLGPNGAGKTTTLRMLLGLVSPTSGNLRLQGHEPGSRNHLDGVGALIEGPAFYPYLSGRDNLRVLAHHAGVAKNRVATVLDTVDLADPARDKYSTYSHGMKQRLGLAAALLKDPSLLILDEPPNGLDPAGMADMRVLIRKLSSEGRTVLLSSHLLGEVEQICDNIGVISQGELVAEKPVAELGSGGTLRVVAHPIDRAYSQLSSVFGTDRVRQDGEAPLDLDVDECDAGRINTELVHTGLTVSELRFCPGPNTGSLVASLGASADTPGVFGLVGRGQAALVVAVYLVAFTVIGGWLLSRRDIV